MRSATVTMSADQYLAGWRPDAGRLFVPTLSEAQLGEQVAVRVGLAGHDQRATVFGVVALVRRVGRPALPPGAELQLDDESRAAAEWLSSLARGVELSTRDRAPRFAAAREIFVIRDRVAVPVTTTNVSSTGGALRWTGPAPAPGERIALRLGDGILAVSPEAIVAWTAAAARGPVRVGFRIVASGRAARAWAQLATDAERQGACRV